MNDPEGAVRAPDRSATADRAGGPGTPGAGASGAGALAVLRRLTRPRNLPRPGEACEMCGEVIPEQHSHVADIAVRHLMCTCRGCYLLFTPEGAGGSRHRAVPERYRLLDDFALAPGQWEAIGIPVDLVFFFQQTDLPAVGATPEDPAGRCTLAYYPSPGGATESLLDLAVWADIAAANPAVREMLPDVEALLVRRGADGPLLAHLVPIDACYELVGIVRQFWVGFAGGAEVAARIDTFFAGLAGRSRGRSRMPGG